MLSFFDPIRVYFAREPVDMRKQIDGLALMVQESMELDPFGPSLFAFCNRRRDKVKVLFWHDNGYCLLYKRIEQSTFKWPTDHGSTATYSARELKWLLEGLCIDSVPALKRLHFDKV